MARRRRSGRRNRFAGLGKGRSRRFGAHRRFSGLGMITLRRTSGLGEISRPGTIAGAVLPPVIGAGVAILTALGIREFMTPKEGGAPLTEGQITTMQYAPWIGLGAGTLAALALANISGKPAGYSSFAGAAVTTLALVSSEMVSKRKLALYSSGEGIQAMRPYGLGAIVPEYGNRLGAIAFEPQASRGYGAGQLGSYGETVNLGNINVAAFGTPGFNA